ncbi:sodium- and chloride-dependent glycine transporter 2-like protein, partial [Dinothrombium tinctorium]
NEAGFRKDVTLRNSVNARSENKVNEMQLKRGHEDNYCQDKNQSQLTLKRNDSMTSIKSRGNWGSKWEFLLSCVGLSVGIGNVWRFPYLAYENGGGAFLIPYLIMLFLAGKPMYFMELAFGQFAGTGPLSIWTCCPIAKGVGAAMVCVSIVVVIYYNVVMSYALYFIYSTFQKELPWNRCDPEWSNGTNCVIRSLTVWQAAASQMFFSLSVSMGGLIMYSSYNDFRHNIFKDAMIVSILDTVTSVISGMVIFSVLGAMSHELGLKVNDVVKSGPGLAFVAYPEALSRLPWPHVWSVLFFLMLFILGLDSEFAILETVLTSLSDEINFLRRHKLKFTVAVGICCFLLGLPCVTRGGQYIFEIMDYYGGGISLVFIAVFECIAISWVYGYKKFALDIYFMLSKQMGFYWHVTWKYTSPIILAFIAIYSLINHTPLHYGDYDFPSWADSIGWCLTAFIVFQIPFWALIAIFKQNKGDTMWEKLKLAIKSTEHWGPKEAALKEEWRILKTGINSVYIVKKDLEAAKEPAKLSRFEMKIGSENKAYKSEEKY